MRGRNQGHFLNVLSHFDITLRHVTGLGSHLTCQWCDDGDGSIVWRLRILGLICFMRDGQAIKRSNEGNKDVN